MPKTPARRAIQEETLVSAPSGRATDRSVPRVLAVTATLAALVGLVGVLLGSYLITGQSVGAEPGPSLAVPVAGSASSAPTTSTTPDASVTPSATPTPSATQASARATTTKATSKASTTARTTAAGVTTAATTAAGASGLEQQVFTLTNTQRAANGCPALTWNTTLATVARAHSQDMAAKNYFDHNSLTGATPAQRIQAAGYAYKMTAENIAAGQATPDAVMTAWMNSAGHKANIVNCALTELGVGFATGGTYGTYWTQDFGTR